MKIYLDTIGCRLNQSEIETMARQFRAAGHEIIASAELADLAVINTCAVTNDAASDSRARIRQVARAGVNEIIATGCWATLQPNDAASLPNVLHIVPNNRKDHLVAYALNIHPFDAAQGRPSSLIISTTLDTSLHSFDFRFDKLSAVAQDKPFDLEPISREPLPGLHRRTRAFIKVQDGCDSQCTFCITTVARGAGRSRPAADVIPDIQFALKGGAKEIVLTGVHLASWGYDFDSRLIHLVEAILRETDVPRLRLSSLEPWDLDANFFSLWTNSRLMPHLHLPLQSGCGSTLRRMARKTTPRSFRELVCAARAAIPDVAITTDIIAGFPGETEEEFAETLDFVREMNFAGGHVFTYSARPGTAAARMKGQVRPEVRKRRNHILRDALEESARSYRERFVGRAMSVLWESTSEMGEWGWQMEGLTENYLRVQAFASSPHWNEIDNVVLTEMTDSGMKAEIIQFR